MSEVFPVVAVRLTKEQKQKIAEVMQSGNLPCVDDVLTGKQKEKVQQMVTDFVTTMVQLSHRSDGIYGG